MKRKTFGYILRQWDKETKRLQHIAWAEQTARMWAIQREADKKREAVKDGDV